MWRFRPAQLMVVVAALAAAIGALGVSSAPRAVQAQPAARVEVTPSSAPPGASVTLRGSGWPAGATLTARMYRSSDLNGVGADLGMAFQANASGDFTIDGVIPRTLFGAGSRGNVEVIPGAYTIVVRTGPELSADTPFTVIAMAPVQAPGALPRAGDYAGHPAGPAVVGVIAALVGLLLRSAETFQGFARKASRT
jgi:hypothetical protein